MKTIGRINLGERVRITDPCYEKGIWCSRTARISPGEYKCLVSMEEDRVSAIAIRKVYEDSPKEWDLLTYIYVDSGQAGFFDEEYYPVKNGEDSDDWYKGICEITLHKFGTIDGKGFVSESGYGDGGYGVYAGYNKKGEIVVLKIKFM